MPQEKIVMHPVPFADILREMDLEFLVLGEYGITVDWQLGLAA